MSEPVPRQSETSTPRRAVRPVYAFLAAYVVAGIVWWIILQLRAEKASLTNFLFNFFTYAVPYLVGGAVGYARARAWGGWKTHVGRAVSLIAIAALLTGLGQTIWTAYNVVLQVEIPVFTLADVAWFAYYPLSAYAMISLLRALPIRPDPWQTAISITIALSFAALLFSARGDVFASGDRTTALVYGGYLIGDVALSTIALIAVSVWGGRLGRFLLLISASAILSAVADAIFVARVDAGAYFNGDWPDIIWFASALLDAYALLFLRPVFDKPAMATPTI